MSAQSFEDFYAKYKLTDEWLVGDTEQVCEDSFDAGAESRDAEVAELREKLEKAEEQVLREVLEVVKGERLDEHDYYMSDERAGDGDVGYSNAVADCEKAIERLIADSGTVKED